MVKVMTQPLFMDKNFMKIIPILDFSERTKYMYADKGTCIFVAGCDFKQTGNIELQ